MKMKKEFDRVIWIHEAMLCDIDGQRDFNGYRKTICEYVWGSISANNYSVDDISEFVNVLIVGKENHYRKVFLPHSKYMIPKKVYDAIKTDLKG